MQATCIPLPVYEQTATVQYCITQEEHERNTYGETISYTTVASIISSDVSEEYHQTVNRHSCKSHYERLSERHTAMVRLTTGYKKPDYWKRIRSRLFRCVAQNTEECATVVIVFFLFSL